MKQSYENQNRRTWLSISGCSLSLPCFFPSISSAKTNLLPIEYLRMLVGINHPQFLISAFDIYNVSEEQRQQYHDLLQTSVRHAQIILLDSGNYESYWKENDFWNTEAFYSVLGIEPCHLAFCFDKQDTYDDVGQITEQVELSVISAQAENLTATVIPIIHGTQDILLQVSLLVTQRLHPVLIALPERELGSGIIDRAITIYRIRKALDQLGQYYPLHLLGTGNPLSILIYSMCGADSFDGLEWCQTTVDHNTGLLYHFQQREFFGEQTPFCSMPELPYEQATLAHNLLFYQKWMGMIQKSIADETIADFAREILGESFYSRLQSHLAEVA